LFFIVKKEFFQNENNVPKYVGLVYKEITKDQETRAVASVTARKEKFMMYFRLPVSGRNGGNKI